MMTDHEKTVGTIGFQMPSDGENGYGQRANVWIHITLSDDNAADLDTLVAKSETLKWLMFAIGHAGGHINDFTLGRHIKTGSGE